MDELTKEDKIIGVLLEIYKTLKDIKTDQSKLIGLWEIHLNGILDSMSKLESVKDTFDKKDKEMVSYIG